MGAIFAAIVCHVFHIIVLVKLVMLLLKDIFS